MSEKKVGNYTQRVSREKEEFAKLHDGTPVPSESIVEFGLLLALEKRDSQAIQTLVKAVKAGPSQVVERNINVRDYLQMDNTIKPRFSALIKASINAPRKEGDAILSDPFDTNDPTTKRLVEEEEKRVKEYQDSLCKALRGLAGDDPTHHVATEQKRRRVKSDREIH